jgi:hypothetical protein
MPGLENPRDSGKRLERTKSTNRSEHEGFGLILGRRSIQIVPI